MILFQKSRLTINVDTASKFNRSLINRGQQLNAHTGWQVLFTRWTDNSTQISVQYNFSEHYPNLHVPLFERSPGIFVFFFFTHWQIFVSRVLFIWTEYLSWHFVLLDTKPTLWSLYNFYPPDNINPDQSIMTKLKWKMWVFVLLCLCI